MASSLMQLRKMLGTFTPHDSHAQEPVLYHGERRVGAQWPCGCVAYGDGYERLEIVFCRQHYRAWLIDTAGVPHNRHDAGDRRHALRIHA